MAARFDEDTEAPEFNHEINVTPFIDVILVLLIIFMVAAPLATSSIAVQLPSSAQKAKPQTDEPVYVTLQEGNKLYLGEKPVTPADLPAQLAALAKDKSETRIFIRADKNMDYGSIMELLGLLRQNGYLKVGLVGLAAE